MAVSIHKAQDTAEEVTIIAEAEVIVVTTIEPVIEMAVMAAVTEEVVDTEEAIEADIEEVVDTEEVAEEADAVEATVTTAAVALQRPTVLHQVRQQETTIHGTIHRLQFHHVSVSQRQCHHRP